MLAGDWPHHDNIGTDLFFRLLPRPAPPSGFYAPPGNSLYLLDKPVTARQLA